MRDYVTGAPVMAAMMPMCLLVVAGVVEMLTARARRDGRSVTRRYLTAGVIGGLLVAATAPLQAALFLGLPADELSAAIETAAADMAVGAVVSSVAVVGAGAAAGFLGIRFGEMLRRLAPAREGR